MTIKNKQLALVNKLIKDGLWPPRTVCYLPTIKVSIQTDEVPDDIYEVAFVTGMELMLNDGRIELTQINNSQLRMKRHGAQWRIKK